jgi:hypothetical protein
MAAVGTGTSEPLDALRDLCARLPVPQGWHLWATEIAACQEDFRQALALADEHPDALELVVQLIDGRAEPEFDADASPELAAAWRRLEELPLPAGRHPYLDEILPALDALRLLLLALSHSGGS